MKRTLLAFSLALLVVQPLFSQTVDPNSKSLQAFGNRLPPAINQSTLESFITPQRAGSVSQPSASEKPAGQDFPRSEKTPEEKLRDMEFKVKYLEKALRQKIMSEMIQEQSPQSHVTGSLGRTGLYNEKEEAQKALTASGSQLNETELNRRVKEFVGEFETTEESKEPFGAPFFKRGAEEIGTLENVPVPSTYILGPGDSLKIIVWSEMGDETVYDVTVNPEGQVYIPIIGLLSIQGQTVGQFEEAVLGKLAEKFKHFRGQVTLAKIRTLQIFVVGEVAKPGSMIVSALSTALHALVRAGGPSNKGTMRNIKVWRQNQVVTEIDLYKYFLHGDKGQDVLLETGDTLFVGPVGPRVVVKGQVIRPATYELAGENTLSQVIAMTGGVAPGAYTRRVKVFRWQGNERRMIIDSGLTDDQQSIEQLQITNGDEVFVDKAIDEFANEVTIEGPVQKPGTYEVASGTRIRDLISRAGGVIREKIAKDAGQIIRKQAGGKEQMLSFNVQSALNGNERNNLLIQPFDKVVLFAFDQVEPDNRKVVIAGAVRRPGEYIWREGMTVRDLVLRAQGLTNDAAMEAAVARMSNKEETNSQQINLAQIFNNPADSSNVPLQPLDRVNILARGDEIIEPEIVFLKGEVKRPGPYAIKHRGETLSDLIKRAGGLSKRAFAEGTIFSRQTGNLVAEQQLQIAEEVQNDLYQMASNDLKADLMRGGARFSEVSMVRAETQVSGATSTAGLLGGIGTGDMAQVGGISGQIKRESSPYASFENQGRTLISQAARIPIRLDLALKKPMGDDDLELMNGDEIVIPPTPTTVSVVGAVVNPTNILYKEGKTVRHYIDRCGGFADNSNHRRTIVVRANGEVMPLRRVSHIKRGDIVLVPPKARLVKRDTLKETGQIAQILGNLAVVYKVVKP